MKTVPISRRALLQRINQELAKDGKVLKTTPGEMDRPEYGDYFIVELKHYAVTQKKVDPVKLGRDLGVLREFERLVD